MGTSLIDLRQARVSSRDHLPELGAYLSQLIGEPFRFVRMSYGDELTIHFGDLRPGHSPRVKHLLFGSYRLNLRASSWILKSALEPLVITSDIVINPASASFGEALSTKDLEAGKFIEPGSRMIEASPFVVEPVGGFGLQLRMSDGGTLIVLPTSQDLDDSEDEKLADWELWTPSGFLFAGPDLKWSFTPREGAAADRSSDATV